jgi:hypothetical protein
MLKAWAVLCLVLFKAATGSASTQTDSLYHTVPTLSVSGFVDIFYAYDFNRHATDYRQPFLFNHNRHNEFNLNLGLLQLSAKQAKYRGNLAIQAGTYAEDNYAAEQDLLKHVFEANAGISLNKQNTLWLDAGIFGSHIGFESAISTENLTLTRSLLAENSPYFLTGAKLSYEPNSNWLFAMLITNGWQRIRKVQGNSLPSFGTQVSYSSTDNFVLNWSTFIGTDDPDASRRMRYFNNFYGQFFITPCFTITAGFDIGFQQQRQHSGHYDRWFSPVLITQYKFNDNWALALRAEYYADEDAIIISNPSPEQFKTSGFSANIDYSPFSNVVCRLESRWLHSPNNIFLKENGYVNNNAFIVGSLAVKLNN